MIFSNRDLLLQLSLTYVTILFKTLSFLSETCFPSTSIGVLTAGYMLSANESIIRLHVFNAWLIDSGSVLDKLLITNGIFSNTSPVFSAINK